MTSINENKFKSTNKIIMKLVYLGLFLLLISLLVMILMFGTRMVKYFLSGFLILLVPIFLYRKDKNSKFLIGCIATLFTLLGISLIFFMKSPLGAIICIVSVSVASLYDDKKVTRFFSYMGVLATLITIIFFVDLGIMSRVTSGVIIVLSLFIINSASEVILNRNTKLIIELNNHLSRNVNLLDNIQKIIISLESSSSKFEFQFIELSKASEEISNDIVVIAENVSDETAKYELITDSYRSIDKKINMTKESNDEVLNQLQRILHLTKSGKEQAESTVEKVETLTKSSEQASRDIINLVESTSKISNLIEAISSIATQTNLLALNASIEAARAGDAGKGFAVVAFEVGNLSEVTQNVVEEVDMILSEIKSKVENVENAVSYTNANIVGIKVSNDKIISYLEEIVDDNIKSNNDLNEIGNFVSELSLVSDNVLNEVINSLKINQKIDESIHTVSATGEEQIASISSMNFELSCLRESIDELASLTVK